MLQLYERNKLKTTTLLVNQSFRPDILTTCVPVRVHRAGCARHSACSTRTRCSPTSRGCSSRDCSCTAASLSPSSTSTRRSRLTTSSAGVSYSKCECSPKSTTERRVPELIQVLGSQPAGDVVSHKPGGSLPLLSARPAVRPTLAALKRAATNFAAW